MDVQVDSLARI